MCVLQPEWLQMLSVDQSACLLTGVYLAVAVWRAGDISGGVEACVAVVC